MNENEVDRLMDVAAHSIWYGVTAEEIDGVWYVPAIIGQNVTFVLPHYGSDVAAAFALAERVHQLIMNEDPKAEGVNYLTLVCTGVTTGWAASFDPNVEEDVEWWEHAGSWKFSAKGKTPARAIRDAALRAGGYDPDAKGGG